MRERLPRLRMYNQNGRDVVVEEDARNAARAVRDLETQLVFLVASCEIAPKLGCAVLVGVDDPSAEGPELGRDNLQEVLEHVVVLRGLENQHLSTNGRGLQ